MDRRKLNSKNTLFKPIFSASQTLAKTVAESQKEKNIGRSISAIENLSISRKRKNLEDEDDEDTESGVTSPVNTMRTNKRRKTVIDSDSDCDMESSPKRSPSMSIQSEKDQNERFPKPKVLQTSGLKKKTNNTDKDGENEQSNASGGSYIIGVLAALDKSPSKLSQSSNSSVERYRKINLRTPLRSRLQRPISKAIAEKKKKRRHENQERENLLNESRVKTNLKQNLPEVVSKNRNSSNKSKNLEVSTNENDEEMSLSDSDTSEDKAVKKIRDNSPKNAKSNSPKKKSNKNLKTNLKHHLPQKVSKRKEVSSISKNFEVSTSENDEEMSLSDSDTSVDKAVKKIRDNSPNNAKSNSPKKKSSKSLKTNLKHRLSENIFKRKEISSKSKNLEVSTSKNDEEMSLSDSDTSIDKAVRKIRDTSSKNAKSNRPQKKSSTNLKTNLKRQLPEDVFKTKDASASISKNLEVSTNENVEEMSFSDSDTSIDKAIKKVKHKNKSLTSKISPMKTPVESNRSRVLDSPELSPLKSFDSPEKDFVTQRRKKTSNKQTDDKFINFLDAAGITLYSGETLHSASANAIETAQKMKVLLKEENVEIDEIIRSWNNYIEDEENLKKSFLEIKIETDEGISISAKAISLTRILLNVPQIQTQIFNSLFQKLTDAVIATDSSDDAPWALLMLQQFRFLEVLVDPDNFITKIEELLSTTPEWFQRELIVFLPDMITDFHHRSVAEMLVKILENNKDLLNIILDCINNLIVEELYLEEIREKVLTFLDKDVDKSSVPVITRFILNDCGTEETALKSLKALRLIDMTPSSDEKIEDVYTSQMFMINAIKSSLRLSKEVSQAALTIIKTPASEAVPLDIIITLMLYEIASTKKKVIETIFLSHIKNGYYKTSILHLLYTGYKSVAASFQTIALDLAIHLLKTDSAAHVEFGIEWLRNMFASQSDTSYKQREIMESLLRLLGNKDKTVKNALEVLCRMANDEKERKYLQQQAGFLRVFLEKIDNLEFQEVATLYHLLHGLCTQSELISSILNDDLNIVMQKQLCSSKVVTKCKGALGAAMAIKHLASKAETRDEAFELLKETLNSLKVCFRSETLFYDQLGQIIAAANSIDDEFLSNITNHFEDIFVGKCLVENNLNDEFEPKFGLNDPSMADSYFVNFESGKTGAFVPIFFKLLRICNLRLSGSLESINAVLGCSILMPTDLDMPDPTTADYIIHCINWFRELISGFVTQEETLLREQVLKRLDSLMTLQGEFVLMSAMLGTNYQPPPCYFHYFPIPQLVRVDMKLGKRGGKKGGKKSKKKDNEEDKTDTSLSKSVLLPEWENWEIGSELAIKNPAYFRKMDTKIINLLDVNMAIRSSQASPETITIAQVCFIVKEVLGMFNNQTSESLIQDLIQLLPKICAKFKNIIEDLRQNGSAHEKEAIKLLLKLLITIFSWKEFQSAKYNTLLRDGLRTLAGMMDESSALLRSCKDLVAEAYKYFESLSDIATQISLALSLVNTCGCLMKHSNSFTDQAKDRQAKMAYGFLCLEWNNETYGAQYKAAVKELLTIWLENEPDPLQTVISILEWLPEEVLSLDRPKSRLKRLPSIMKIILHLLIKQLFVCLVRGIDVSLGLAERDPERIRVWFDLASCLDKMANICKTIKNTAYLVLFLRYSSIFYQKLLTSGMSVLEVNIKYQPDEVLSVIKLFQKTGRFLRDIFCTARKENNMTLLNLIPVAKSKREKFIYRVKGMLTANNSIGAFWMGNLLNKDLDGEEIPSESSEDLTTGSGLTTENNTANASDSEVFNSESEDDVEDDEE